MLFFVLGGSTPKTYVLIPFSVKQKRYLVFTFCTSFAVLQSAPIFGVGGFGVAWAGGTVSPNTMVKMPRIDVMRDAPHRNMLTREQI